MSILHANLPAPPTCRVRTSHDYRPMKKACKPAGYIQHVNVLERRASGKIFRAKYPCFVHHGPEGLCGRKFTNQHYVFLHLWNQRDVHKLQIFRDRGDGWLEVVEYLPVAPAVFDVTTRIRVGRPPAQVASIISRAPAGFNFAMPLPPAHNGVGAHNPGVIQINSRGGNSETKNSSQPIVPGPVDNEGFRGEPAQMAVPPKGAKRVGDNNNRIKNNLNIGTHQAEIRLCTDFLTVPAHGVFIDGVTGDQYVDTVHLRTLLSPRIDREFTSFELATALLVTDNFKDCAYNKCDNGLFTVRMSAKIRGDEDVIKCIMGLIMDSSKVGKNVAIKMLADGRAGIGVDEDQEKIRNPEYVGIERLLKLHDDTELGEKNRREVSHDDGSCKPGQIITGINFAGTSVSDIMVAEAEAEFGQIFHGLQFNDASTSEFLLSETEYQMSL